MEEKTMEQFIETFMSSELRRMILPMELRCGWPAITQRNNEICVVLSFYRAEPAKEKKISIYPLCQSLILRWKDAKLISYRNLNYEKEFAGMDFTKPVGYFRHEAIKDWDKQTYMQNRKQLFTYYDRLIQCIATRGAFEEKEEMAALLGIMMEPAQYPMYLKMAPKFFGAYCNCK